MSKLWLSRFQVCVKAHRLWLPHDTQTVLHPKWGSQKLKSSVLNVNTDVFLTVSRHMQMLAQIVDYLIFSVWMK